MAKQIDRDAELLVLANSALKHSVALHNTINGYKDLPKPVRDLREELEDLNGVLGVLSDTINTSDNTEFTALKIPLQRCGNACREFEESVIEYSNRICDGRMSFRDWTEIRYIGEDIYGFRDMVAGYKSTIKIALAEVNL